jgi:hypothetical protein
MMSLYAVGWKKSWPVAVQQRLTKSCFCAQVYTDPAGTINDFGEVVGLYSPPEGYNPLHHAWFMPLRRDPGGYGISFKSQPLSLFFYITSRSSCFSLSFPSFQLLYSVLQHWGRVGCRNRVVFAACQSQIQWVLARCRPGTELMVLGAMGQVNDLDLIARVTPISEPLRNDYTLQQALSCPCKLYYASILFGLSS